MYTEKRTPTLKISNFKSNRPASSQYGILKGLLNRAHKLCDEGDDWKDETEFFTHNFIANEYKAAKKWWDSEDTNVLKKRTIWRKKVMMNNWRNNIRCLFHIFLRCHKSFRKIIKN